MILKQTWRIQVHSNKEMLALHSPDEMSVATARPEYSPEYSGE